MMELLLRLSSGLPREIVSEAFFKIRPPKDDDFITACKEGKNLLLLEQWLYFGLVDVSRYNVPIQIAAMNGHPSVVSLLIAHGAYPSVWNDITLILAARNGHLLVVSLLLDHVADLSIKSNALFHAVKNDHLSVVSFLLDHGVEPTPDTLNLAAWKGHTSIVSLLIEHGAAINDHIIFWAERNGHSGNCSPHKE